MAERNRPPARPVRVPRAARDLIRQVAPGDAEQTASPPPSRSLSIGEEEWLARVEGEAVIGAGDTAPARIVAIRFYRAAAPEDPIREALLPSGRFDALYDEELRTLFERATVLTPPDESRG